MKLFTASVFVGLASLVASDDVSDINDYFYGLDATDVAPNSCTSAAEYFSCYRPISAYENCDSNDFDSCYCSSASIEEDCQTKYCPNLSYDSYHLTRYCKATATPVSSPAKTTAPASSASTTSHSSTNSKSSSSSNSARAALASSSSSSAGSATPAALATDSSAQSTSTASSTASSTDASSKPNAGGRSVVVSVRGVVVAVAALAVAGGFA